MSTHYPEVHASMHVTHRQLIDQIRRRNAVLRMHRPRRWELRFIFRVLWSGRRAVVLR